MMMVYSKPTRGKVAGFMTLKSELCSTDVNLVLLTACLHDSGMNSLKTDDDMITYRILMESKTLKVTLKREHTDTAYAVCDCPVCSQIESSQ